MHSLRFPTTDFGTEEAKWDIINANVAPVQHNALIITYPIVTHAVHISTPTRFTSAFFAEDVTTYIKEAVVSQTFASQRENK